MSTIEAPKMLGPFQVLRQISTGRLGETYLCKRISGTARDHVPFVAKTYRPDLVEMRKDVDALERPLHRNLIQYRQVGFDAEAERYYVIMDRLQVEPHSVDLMQNRRPKFNFKQKVKRFVEVGEALATLHEQVGNDGSPLYHGNLRPRSVLVRRPQADYHMVISDYGFDYKSDEQLYREDDKYFQLWLFMAPEMILRSVPEHWTKNGPPPAPCPASDVYSWTLAMVYSLNGGRDGFHYMTGKTQGDDRYDERVREDIAILYQKKLDVRDRWTLVVGGKAELERERFIEFLFRSLEPDPRDRFGTMHEALQAFRKCLL